MEIIVVSITLLVILFFIVLACVVFTNAIEHLGEKLNLSEGAVGSVFAAVGTALPETIVPLVAIIGGYVAGTDVTKNNEIGIGAILGAPFMLGTLAFFVTGLAVLIFTRTGRRTSDMPVNTIIMFRDLHYFAGAFFISIVSSFIPYTTVRYFIAALLVLAYIVYAVQTVRTASKVPDGGHEELDALYFTKYLPLFRRFEFPSIIVQIIIALAGIVLLAHLFVEELKVMAGFFHINPLILSLIITPIATELPEKFNSVLWIRSKKDTLAIGNITGAMVFQSCIPSAIGIIFTPWVLNIDAIINVIMVYLSVGVVYMNIVMNKGILKPTALITGGFFYIFYLCYVLYQLRIQL